MTNPCVPAEVLVGVPADYVETAHAVLAGEHESAPLVSRLNFADRSASLHPTLVCAIAADPHAGPRQRVAARVSGPLELFSSIVDAAVPSVSASLVGNLAVPEPLVLAAVDQVLTAERRRRPIDWVFDHTLRTAAARQNASLEFLGALPAGAVVTSSSRHVRTVVEAAFPGTFEVAERFGRDEPAALFGDVLELANLVLHTAA